MSIFAQNYRTELEIYMNQQYPSVLLEKAVGEFSKLPGIGRKTAMRLVLHLLRQDNATVEAFGNSIITLKHEVKYCRVCHNISDTDTCQICANPARDASTVCVVENIRDVMAVEGTQQFRGLYHVLGGRHFSDGWGRAERPADRQSGATGSGRWNKRGDIGFEYHDGRRYDQLLHLSQAGEDGYQTQCLGPWCLHRR